MKQEKNLLKNRLKNQKKKKKIEYKQHTLEELQNTLEKEHHPEELNKIMSTISDKYDVLFDDNEAANIIFSEEQIYRQMNLIKLEDPNVLPLEEIRKKLDKKYDKMTIDDEINEIGEELDLVRYRPI